MNIPADPGAGQAPLACKNGCPCDKYKFPAIHSVARVLDPLLESVRNLDKLCEPDVEILSCLPRQIFYGISDT